VGISSTELEGSEAVVFGDIISGVMAWSLDWKCLNQPRQGWPTFATRSTCIIAHKLLALTLLNAVYIDILKYNSLLEVTTTINLEDKVKRLSKI